jgi:dipeptidyl aminopeptidase/acylaminoacyl peptidase
MKARSRPSGSTACLAYKPLVSRRVVAASACAAFAPALFGCGGGGGGEDGSGGGGGGGGGGSGPTGLAIVKSTLDLSVHNFATGVTATYPASAVDFRVGVDCSRTGVIADLNNAGGTDSWEILLIDARTGATIRRIAVTRPSGLATSTVTINPDATRIAFGVNETRDANSTDRVDRTLVVNLANLETVRIEGVSQPVFVGNDLIVRVGERLRLLNSNLDDQGDLGVNANDELPGSVSPSRDGRYIAYERDRAIWVLDRSTSQTWKAVDEIANRTNSAFSPDGRYFAMLGEPAGPQPAAGTYLMVIPFVPGTLTEVTNANQVSGSRGSIRGGGRIAWIEA